MVDAQCLLLRSEALPLLLQHESICKDIGALLMLSWTSKSMQTAVLQHCKGLAALRYWPKSEQPLQQFSQWLFKHGQLLGCIALQCSQDEHTCTGSVRLLARKAESAVAEAMQRHAKLHGPLPIKHLDHGIAYQDAGSILQAISSQTLINLTIRTDGHRDKVSMGNYDLSAFSKLETLSIPCLPMEEAAPVLAALPALVNLRDLRLSGWITAEQVAQSQQQFPSRLESLTLHAWPIVHTATEEPLPQPILQLQQLTALTFLDVFAIQEGWQLPQQLVTLHCEDCSCMDPLLSCSKLQELHISDCTTPAEQLSKLSDLTSLTDFHLAFRKAADGAPDAALAACGRGSLTSVLRSLSLQEYRQECAVLASTIEYAGCFTALTSLVVGVNGTPITASPAELAAVLQHLTGLQCLELYADPGSDLLQPVLQEPEPVPVDLVRTVHHLTTLIHPHFFNDILGQHGLPGLASPALATALQEAAAEVEDAGEILHMLENDHPELMQELNQVAVQFQQVMQQQQDEDPPEEWVAPFMLPLTAAIAALPQLVSLKLMGNGFSAETTEPLTAMTRLTRLSMSSMDFDDLALIQLVYSGSLMGLKWLSLSYSETITDASLIVISHHLKQLTQLNLNECTALAHRGVEQLTRLTHLVVLEAFEDPHVPTETVEYVLHTIEEQRQTAG